MIRLKTGFRKNMWKWCALAVILILAGAFVLSKQSLPKRQKAIDEDSQKEDKGEIVALPKIEIVFDENGHYWNNGKPIIVADDKMIDDILQMIDESKPLTDESKVSNMSGMASNNNKLIAIAGDGSKREFTFAFDTLYEIGYIEQGGKKFEPDYSFFRYIADLTEYQNPDTNVESQVVELFFKYGWTVDYKINTLKEKLPDNLKHKAGEYPDKIYWAYNNELSRQVGLDFTAYLGEDVVVEIYRLRETLPEFLEPRRDARGILLKHDGEIVGAYIDAGRHDSFACSLDRKSLQDITGKDWDQWIADYIDYEDELEMKLSQMEPEEIIREYFKALDKHDIKTVWACMTRKNLSRLLSANMDNNDLFNKNSGEIDYNVKRAKLLDIKELEGLNDEPGVLEYRVDVYFDFKKAITSGDGVWPRFVILKKEAEKSGWRIDGIGTGP